MEHLQADLHLVRIYRSLGRGRYEDALLELDRLLTDRPDHGIAHGVMAWFCHNVLDDPRRARVHYLYAIRFAPEVEEHYHRLAELMEQLGDDEGLADLVRLAMGHGAVDRAPILQAAARALERQGRWAEASLRYEEAADHALTDDVEEECIRGAQRMLRRMQHKRWSVPTRA